MTSCDHCGGPAEGPGTITIQVLDDYGLEQFARVKMCPGCAREFGLWLRPVSLPTKPTGTDAESDLLVDDGPETDAV